MECLTKAGILFQHANLKIEDSAIHVKTDMNVVNRVMPFYVLSYIKKGSCRVKIYEKNYYAKEKDVIVIPANIIHDHVKDTDDTTIFMWWHFNFTIDNSVDILKLFNIPVIFRLSKYIYFEKLFAEYVDISKDLNKVENIIMKKAKTLELLSIIIGEALQKSTGQNFRAAYFSDFSNILINIVQNSEKDITLSGLAEKYHLHPTYISNRFKELFGITPIQLKNQIRINKAKSLLVIETETISEIAYKVGYDNPDHFTRYFTNHTGISPSLYRQQVR